MFNEVFFDDVLVLDDCVLGAPGDGWRVAMSTLATDRVAMGGGQDEEVQKLLAAANPDYVERTGVHLASGHAVAPLEERGAHPAIRKLIGTGHWRAVAETEPDPAHHPSRRRHRVPAAARIGRVQVSPGGARSGLAGVRPRHGGPDR